MMLNSNKIIDITKLLSTTIKNDGSTFFDYETPKELSTSSLKSYTGFIIYFIVFIIGVPYFLFKGKQLDLLEAYMPNVDLVANLLSYRGGPFGNNLFSDLYSPVTTNLNAFIQSTLVNYMALLGLTYIIARETYLSKKISHGWGIAFIMLLMTYLLPSQFIVKTMNIIYNQITPFVEKHHFLYSAYIPSVLVGTAITIGIIYLEKQVILYNRKHLTNFADFLLSIPKKL